MIRSDLPDSEIKTTTLREQQQDSSMRERVGALTAPLSQAQLPLASTATTAPLQVPLASNTETASHLVHFYECLNLPEKPKFAGTTIEKAALIREWMQNEGRQQIEAMASLEIKGCDLKVIPPEIRLFTGLKIIDCSGNALTSIPPEIGHLTNLVALNLNDNKLTALPPEIRHLTKLRQLHIMYNQLTVLPQEIRYLTALQILNLSDNPIRVIASAISALPNLRSVNLENIQAPKCFWLLKDALAAEKPTIPVVTPPYNIPQHLGDKDVAPPTVVRADHDTSTIFGPYLSTALQKMGASVHPIDVNCKEIDPIALCTEIHDAMQEIKQTHGQGVSIASELFRLAEPSSLIGQMYTSALETMQRAQGLALPGGDDIEPIFYKADMGATPMLDYRRTIAEFALIAAAHALKKPILGSCRGMQMINVFFGGTIKTVAAQRGWQKVVLPDSSKKASLANILQGDAFFGFSFHDQACDQIAPGFEVVAHYNYIPKMIMSEDGLIIGMQAHAEKPENETYSNFIKTYELFFAQMLRKKPDDDGKRE